MVYCQAQGRRPTRANFVMPRRVWAFLCFVAIRASSFTGLGVAGVSGTGTGEGEGGRLMSIHGGERGSLISIHGGERGCLISTHG